MTTLWTITFDSVKKKLIGSIARNPGDGEYALDILMIAQTLSASATMPQNLSPSGSYSP